MGAVPAVITCRSRSPTPERGIPESVLPSVCEPFFTTRADGTGLGLAIAKRYVEQNGGRLEITSRPGGTTVRLSLPVAVAEAGVPT